MWVHSKKETRKLNMKRKSIVAIILALVLCFAMTACGGNPEVEAALDGKTYYCKADTVNSVVVLSFTGGDVTATDYFADGNGIHESSSETVSFDADEENIAFSTEATGEMVIPYTLDGENIKIGNGEIKSEDEVKDGIQGIWKYRSYSYGTHEHNLKIDGDKAVYQSASESSVYGYDYFWYGPYNCTYTIDAATLSLAGDTTEDFMIIVTEDNKVGMMHFTHTFVKTDKFPDPETDYNF